MTSKRSLVQLCLLGLVLLQAGVGGAQTVTRVAAGFYHSLLLKTNGSLWATGWDLYGQLGNGAYDTSYPYGVDAPVQILSSNVVALAAGGEHSLFLKTNGSLWAMGWNAYGQLGDGTTDAGDYETNRPEQIVASNVVAIAAGLNHSLFLESDGSLWAMGDNSCGQLGDGTNNFGNYLTNRPEKIVGSNVTAIAAGYRHSLFLLSDGSLWGMGDNAYGQLGNGTWSGTNIPVESMASNVMAIAAGDQDSLFLMNDGSLWGMGNNNLGQLGIAGCAATNLPSLLVSGDVTAMSVGSTHVLFLKSGGSLWATGDNHYGQLGDGSLANTNAPVQILSGGVTAVAAGYGHSLFLKTDGSLWGMGDNLTGQLGSGNDTSTNLPEQVVGP
jgi:alpha-tubulin suppressor-like RCC1 family protein